MAKIRLTAGSVSQTATLNDSKTARELLKILPISSSARRWGKEVYFSIPLEMPSEEAVPEVPSGTVAYWPEGPALCIFFGQTPYSPVSVVGTLDGDPEQFDQVGDGESVRVESVE